MKKQIPFLITLSLLIGLLITVATTRIVSINIHGSTCGQSIYALIPNSKSTPINDCNDYEYGWPASYVESSSNVYVLNHSGPAGATVYSYSSFSRLRAGADWLFWSVLSGVVVTSGAYLIKANAPRNRKKPTR